MNKNKSMMCVQIVISHLTLLQYDNFLILLLSRYEFSKYVSISRHQKTKWLICIRYVHSSHFISYICVYFLVFNPVYQMLSHFLYRFEQYNEGEKKQTATKSHKTARYFWILITHHRPWYQTTYLKQYINVKFENTVL